MSLDISFSKKKDKREFPIKEFIDTEDKYLSNLIMVREHFSTPLKLVLPEDLHSIIFFKLEEMISLHHNILEELRRKDMNIGKLLLNGVIEFGMTPF